MALTLRGGLPSLLFAVGLVAGCVALIFTPREEEPQIVVPMIDVLVGAPGLSAQQTERQVTIPLEKLLAQIPGVEHVYSTTDAGSTAVTLRPVSRLCTRPFFMTHSLFKKSSIFCGSICQ